MAFFNGSGTLKDPFDQKVRDVIRQLIRNPRATVADIKRAIEGQVKNISALHVDDLEKGAVADCVRFRVSLDPRRYPIANKTAPLRRAGTSFVNVKLKSTTQKARDEFQEQIQNVIGVIEWDLISGSEIDYLVRVAGRPGDDLVIIHSENIKMLNVVNTVSMNKDIIIWDSGIVDNFDPEHFLTFKE